MTYRAKLEMALSEAFGVERPDDNGFFLRRAAGSPVRVMAAERDVAARAQAIAPDALLALGVIDDDPSGMMAATGLLAIHVEELVASKPTVSVVRITRSGVRGGHGSLDSGAG